MSDKIAEIRKRHNAAPRRVRSHARIPDPSIDFTEAHEDRGWLLAEVERLRAEIERLREIIRTIRARCVELDDSDAVSETLDIATAVLEDEP